MHCCLCDAVERLNKSIVCERVHLDFNVVFFCVCVLAHCHRKNNNDNIQRSNIHGIVIRNTHAIFWVTCIPEAQKNDSRVRWTRGDGNAFYAAPPSN